MNGRHLVLWILALVLLSSPACLFRRKKDPAIPKVYDVLGTVQQASPNVITVQTKEGVETFVMTASTVRGGDFTAGMYVHVYYHRQPDQNVATMVVEKVK